MSKPLISTVAAALLLAGPAFAATVSFESADANGDGSVTMTEAQSAMPEVTDTQFAAADRDADGVLSRTEFGDLASHGG